MGMGGNGNVESHARTSLLQSPNRNIPCGVAGVPVRVSVCFLNMDRTRRHTSLLVGSSIGGLYTHLSINQSIYFPNARVDHVTDR